MIYPNTATRTEGPTKGVHPLALAMAGAVAGPPIFALEAIMASSRLNLKILAPINITSIFIATTIPQNINSSGALKIICDMDAGTPITAIKIAIQNIPIS